MDCNCNNTPSLNDGDKTFVKKMIETPALVMFAGGVLLGVGIPKLVKRRKRRGR